MNILILYFILVPVGLTILFLYNNSFNNRYVTLNFQRDDDCINSKYV